MTSTLLRGCALVLMTAGALLGAGCTGDAPAKPSSGPKASCPAQFEAGWQELANRVGASVYCPGWLPFALPADADHASVGSDGSFQVGFHDPEIRFGDIHAVVARYPGSEFPRCTDLETGENVPCASKPTVRKRLAGLSVTLYERTWGHEANHYLYAWTYRGSLYTVSMHRDRTRPRPAVLQDLERIVRSLERIDPGGAEDSHTSSESH